jgi:hypothetical protein
MNEVIIVAHTGDNFNDLVKTAIEVVKVNTVSYALIEFNGCKVFIKKDSTEESVMAEYLKKLRSA